MEITVIETKRNNVIQVTTLDERWYMRQSDKKVVPSVSWIAGSYPKGKWLEEWKAKLGLEEANAN